MDVLKQNRQEAPADTIWVRAEPQQHRGELTWQTAAGRHTVACAIGASGLSTQKSEGDGITPIGAFALRQIWYRPDRITLPACVLPERRITENDGWSDDPCDPAYNQAVRRPHPHRHETLWREDHLYDVLIEIGYNDAPATPGLGSAIFLHLQKNNYQATRGCVAIDRAHMLALIPALSLDTKIKIDAAA